MVAQTSLAHIIPLAKRYVQIPLAKRYVHGAAGPADVPPVMPMDSADRACAAASWCFHRDGRFRASISAARGRVASIPAMAVAAEASSNFYAKGPVDASLSYVIPRLSTISSHSRHSGCEKCSYVEASSIAQFTCRRRGGRFREARSIGKGADTAGQENASFARKERSNEPRF